MSSEKGQNGMERHRRSMRNILTAMILITAVLLSLFSRNQKTLTITAGDNISVDDLGFTSTLPFEQKSDTEISIPLAGQINDDDSIHLLKSSASSYSVSVSYRGLLPYTNTFGSSELGIEETLISEMPEFPLSDVSSLADTLQYYYDRGYLLFLYTEDDCSEGWDESLGAFLDSAGVQHSSAADFAGPLLILIYGDQVHEKIGDEAADVTYKVGEHHLEGETADSPKGYSVKMTSIKLDGKEVSGNYRGLNVIVYDPISAELIDSLGFRMDGIRTEGMHADIVYDRQVQITFNAELLRQIQRVANGFRIYDLILIWVAAALLILLVLDLTFSSSKRDSWIETEMIRQRSSAIRSVIYTALVLLSVLVFAAVLFLEGQGVKCSSLLWHTAANDLLFSRLSSIELAASAGVLIGMTIVRKQSGIEKQRRGLALSVLILAGTIALTASFSEAQGLISFFSSQSLQDPLYEEVYVNPETAEIEFPEQKKNLIYIFLESVEVTAADYASGGGLAENTIPELTELAETYDDFSGTDSMLNGAIPLKDSTWTAAAMAAQTSGLPLQENMAYINNGIAEKMMPGAVTIGDILEQNGYQNAVLMGSDGDFGNRNTYFTEHGDYEILDLNTLKDKGWLPSDYKQNWGFEDSKLFEFAKREAEELASSGQPFNLTLLTADTHYPTGYLCSDCPDTFAEKYANVTACSSRRVAEFVSWVQEQEWGKDTVIVINGDHCYMGTDYYDYIPHDYLRKTYTCMINSSKEEPSEARTYSTMDLFPTTLSALGCSIPGGRLGLGTDLYSATPTLLETNTIETLNHELSMHSTFYQKDILQYYTAHRKDQ